LLVPGLGSNGRKLSRLFPPEADVHRVLWDSVGSIDHPLELAALWIQKLPTHTPYTLVVQSLGAALVNDFCAHRLPRRLIVLSGPFCAEELPFGARWPGLKEVLSLVPAKGVHTAVRRILQRGAPQWGLPKDLPEFDRLSPKLYKALLLRFLERSPSNRFMHNPDCEVHRIFDPTDRLSGVPKYGILHPMHGGGHLLERKYPDVLSQTLKSILLNLSDL